MSDETEANEDEVIDVGMDQAPFQPPSRASSQPQARAPPQLLAGARAKPTAQVGKAKGKREGIINYCQEDIDTLLSIVEKIEPLGEKNLG